MGSIRAAMADEIKAPQDGDASVDDSNPSAIALKNYFESKGVSPEDIETTVRVLNVVSGLSHKNSNHKRKHVGSVINSKKKKKDGSSKQDVKGSAQIVCNWQFIIGCV